VKRERRKFKTEGRKNQAAGTRGGRPHIETRVKNFDKWSEKKKLFQTGKIFGEGGVEQKGKKKGGGNKEGGRGPVKTGAVHSMKERGVPLRIFNNRRRKRPSGAMILSQKKKKVGGKQTPKKDQHLAKELAVKILIRKRRGRPRLRAKKGQSGFCQSPGGEKKRARGAPGGIKKKKGENLPQKSAGQPFFEKFASSSGKKKLFIPRQREG